jgi:hypothetical protein
MMMISGSSSNNSTKRLLSTISDRYHQSTLQSIPQHFLLHRNEHEDDEKKRQDRYNIFQSSSSNNVYNTSTSSLFGRSILQNNTQNFTSSSYSMITSRDYHTTQPEQRGAAIVLTLGAVAATAKAGQYAVQGYQEWKVAMEEERKQRELDEKNRPKDQEEESANTTHKAQDESKKNDTANNDNASNSSSSSSNKKGEKRENFFAKFFNLSVGSKYYEGGFEEQMTRKEAALILGVRESSTAKRIKEAHRKLLILNHPDTGGSTYMAGKINEAKELLLKGKK